MNPFFVSSGPEDPGDPDRPGRLRPDPAEGTGTADPADRPDRRPRRLTGEDPAGGRHHPRRQDGDRRPGSGEGVLAGAMRYRPESQSIPSGGTLLLELSETHGEGIQSSGDGGLLLAPGQYLCSFAADAEGEGDCGAVFALNGATLPFTAAQLPGPGRLVLTALPDLIGAAILTVENNCGGTVQYHNAVLTVIRLS